MFAHDTFSAPARAAAHGVRYTDFETLLATSDFFSLHAELARVTTANVLQLETGEASPSGLWKALC